MAVAPKRVDGPPGGPGRAVVVNVLGDGVPSLGDP